MAKKRLVIDVPRYTGKDRKKRMEYQRDLELAKRIEDHINPQLDDERAITFHYSDIGRALGIDPDKVHRLLRRNGGGPQAITL